MASESLSIESLNMLDSGIVTAGFQHELRLVAKDLEDRPQLKKKRQILLQMDVEPSNETGRVVVKFRVKSKIPERGSTEYTMNLTGDGQLIFKPSSPDDPDQMTFDEVKEKKAS